MSEGLTPNQQQVMGDFEQKQYADLNPELVAAADELHKTLNQAEKIPGEHQMRRRFSWENGDTSVYSNKNVEGQIVGSAEVRHNVVNVKANHDNGSKVNYRLDTTSEIADDWKSNNPDYSGNVSNVVRPKVEITRTDASGEKRTTYLSGERREKAAAILQKRAARAITKKIIDNAV